MRVNDDYTLCNVKAQINRPDSVWSFWQTMLGMRKAREDDLVSYLPRISKLTLGSTDLSNYSMQTTHKSSRSFEMIVFSSH